VNITPDLFAVFVLENAKNHLLDRDSKDSAWWVLESAQWAVVWLLSERDAEVARTIIQLSSLRRAMRLRPTEEAFPLRLPKEIGNDSAS
jgi:hypothetical protein